MQCSNYQNGRKIAQKGTILEVPFLKRVSRDLFVIVPVILLVVVLLGMLSLSPILPSAILCAQKH
jgi:hypothetical protein